MLKKIQKAVITKGDKYLVVLRIKEHPIFPDHWDFPGGQLEFDEDPVAGIVREVKEETDLDIVPGEVVVKCEIEVNGNMREFFVYSVKSYTGEIKISDEHQEYKWLTKEEILNLKKYEPFITKYFQECN